MKNLKNNKANLEKMRGLFFQIGLMIAGGLTLLAFEWTTPVYISKLPVPPIDQLEDDLVALPDVLKKIEKPVAKIVPPKVDPTAINVVEDEFKDEVKKEEKKEEEQIAVQEFNLEDWAPIEDPDPDPNPVVYVSKMPHYEDCKLLSESERTICTQRSFYEHFADRLKIPEVVKNMGRGEYTAFVYFEVNKKGEVRKVKLLNDEEHAIHPLLEKEALRAVSSLPNMIPGSHHGKKMIVSYKVPIKFTVN